MGIMDSAKNAALASGVPLFVPTNEPDQYDDRQRQFFDAATTMFSQERARYSTDFVKGRAQSMDKTDPMKFVTVYLRMADIGKPNITTSKSYEDYKRVLIAGRQADYLQPGAKIEAMKSTWLVVNPDNLSGIGANGVVQRCNTTWNYLDYYGNVCQEPISTDRALARANNTDTQEAMNLTKGYFDVKCQYNEATKQLAENSRMILGSGAYRVTGFSDFVQEFTGDYSTVRMLEFSIHYEEPNYVIDDMVNRVAGGKQFSWEVSVSGQPNMAIGETAQFTAASQRMKEAVQSTAEHPISYTWSSSDESIATVDAQGVVTAVSGGECVITATLAQNPAMTAQMPIAVVPAEEYGAVKFLQTPPASLQYAESVTLEAAYFLNGQKDDRLLTWLIGGADPESYAYELAGNTLTITCWGGSVTPLTVTALWGETKGLTPGLTVYPDASLFPESAENAGEATITIELEGY